jgi:ADP-ribosyl-[dinitrogen reductase] hydrolase
MKGRSSPLIPTTPVSPSTLTHRQTQAAFGAILGSAVGDALGAPFEFESPGLYARRFPQPILGGTAEMVGGGSFKWAVGEFTDDTQMALALAEAFLARDGQFDPAVLWKYFVSWSKDAVDVGNITRLALGHSNYQDAAERAHDVLGRSGGNGGVMRTTPLGLLGVRWGRDKTMSIARQQAGLTHLDPIAQWSSSVVAEVIRALILGADFESALAGALSVLPDDEGSLLGFMLHSDWNPSDTQMPNGTALICLAQAVWAIRSTTSFEDAVVRAINLGGDTDTVAAVCGAMAGALYGIQRIPARWTTYVHGSVRHPSGRVVTYHYHDLLQVAHQLLGKSPRSKTPFEPVIPVSQVHNMGVFASNAAGACDVDSSFGVVSLCRMEDALHHVPHRREYYILDSWGEGQNPHLHAVCEDAVNAVDGFLRDGKNVLVHCHGGRSRTGFVLKAWYMRRYQGDHEEAHDWLAERWPHYVTWNDDFEDFLSSEWQFAM